MFGGYENFSTYFVDGNDVIGSSDNDTNESTLPEEFQPHIPVPDPWFCHSERSEDLVVIAEFSELEGPVPRVCSLLISSVVFFSSIDGVVIAHGSCSLLPDYPDSCTVYQLLERARIV